MVQVCTPIIWMAIHSIISFAWFGYQVYVSNHKPIECRLILGLLDLFFGIHLGVSTVMSVLYLHIIVNTLPLSKTRWWVLFITSWGNFFGFLIACTFCILYSPWHTCFIDDGSERPYFYLAILFWYLVILVPLLLYFAKQTRMTNLINMEPSLLLMTRTSDSFGSEECIICWNALKTESVIALDNCHRFHTRCFQPFNAHKLPFSM